MPTRTETDLAARYKRLQRKLDMKSDPRADVELGLRNRRVPPAPTLKKSRRTFRNDEKYAYPSKITTGGVKSSRDRRPMSVGITKDLVAASKNSLIVSSSTRDIVPLPGRTSENTKLKKTKQTSGNRRKKNGSDLEPQNNNTDVKFNLSGNNASRNHILADSRIKVILDTIYDKNIDFDADMNADKASESSKGNPRRSIAEFFEALCGRDRGAKLQARFEKASAERDSGKLKDIINDACEGLKNLRIGLADINVSITNEFDPITLDGRLTAATMLIRDAVIGLASAGLIEHDKMMDSLAVTKDKLTREDVSSTALKRSKMTTETGSRTVIDQFAHPANEKMLVKSHSILSSSTDPSADPPAEIRWRPAPQPSREFHYLSRSNRSDLMSDINE